MLSKCQNHNNTKSNMSVCKKYHFSVSNYSGIQGLDADCNKNCGCTTSAFEPICDSNQTVYFSPCHAGCTNVTFVNGEKVFQPCINSKVPSFLCTLI